MAEKQLKNLSHGGFDWRQLPGWWCYFAWFVLLLIFFWIRLNPARDHRLSLSYSEFKTEIANDQVAWAELQGDRISGEFNQPRTRPTTGGEASYSHFVIVIPPVQDPALIGLLGSLAQALLEKETLEADDIQSVLGRAEHMARNAHRQQRESQ